MSKLEGLYILNPHSFDLIYGAPERADIERYVHFSAPPQTRQSVRENPAVLAPVDVIFSGWGGPVFDAEFLDAAPRLEAVFYGAGSIRSLVTAAFWDRGIRITSAYAANAVPVAEFALAQILLCLKHAWAFAREVRERRAYPPKEPVPGAYDTTVGIVSLGRVGRRVCQLLQPFDIHVLAHDPFVTDAEAKELGIEELCDLDTLFQRADVISLHAPWLPETENMIRGRHLEALKTGAAFINTARGAIVHEAEMIEVLQKRPDLQAVLDVTYPEPPRPESPLYTLPNVMLTPHIAGSMHGECRRMGRTMVSELERFVKCEPLQWGISREKAATLA